IGEAKKPKLEPDTQALCHDLLRLTVLSKEAIDWHHLTGCISFQINGFTTIFYMMRLRHIGIYTMLEIARLSYPPSLRDLSTFISWKNLKTLMQMSEVFWRL
ncbi:uncharacterized protein BYT42DRAFT_482443, partial [Radiomyces spectabilis]|uniref:uncharacterized protein n=1 Tax=Radiomyces spectabilis TaxID=64574 RepID=UPI002220904C